MTMINPSPTAYNKDDWMTGDSPALVTGQYMEFGRITCGAGVGYVLGYGLSEGQDSARGRVYIDLKTAANAAVQGDLRIEILDATDKVQRVIWQGRTEQVNVGSGDRTKQMPFPIIPFGISENKKFSFKIKVDANATINKANSTIQMDGAEYEDK